MIPAKARHEQVTLSWGDIRDASEGELGERGPSCGPFAFEIRAWDISSSDTEDLAQRFQIAKANVRKSIRAHKGISVYRDGILVLPSRKMPATGLASTSEGSAESEHVSARVRSLVMSQSLPTTIPNWKTPAIARALCRMPPCVTSKESLKP